MMNKVKILDSTLRDGAQGEGISFSVADKLRILQIMDDLGIGYVEAGNPGSNPKDLEFFKKVSEMNLQNTKLAAFGSTRRRGIKVEDDANVKSLMTADTPVVVIFGKSWDFHATEIIKCSLEENLDMIRETMAFFKDQGKEVIFDAEHFFDGYVNNADYAMKALQAAADGGASTLCLCETNGGKLPSQVSEITATVKKAFPDISVGIHTHNDGGMAVANSVVAVQAGADHIQGTFIGFGERCGNANLSTIISNLELKCGYSCVPEGKLEDFTSAAVAVAEISNIFLTPGMPYVGKSAFAHKGGMHIDGVNKNPLSFEHVPPESVGNSRRFLMSEVAGRGTILKSIQKVDPSLTKESPETRELIEKLKQFEMEGYQFEGAESSFELMIRKHLGLFTPFFELDHYKIIGENPPLDANDVCSAVVKIRVGDQTEFTAGQGDGPVNALDEALRKALYIFYPVLKEVRLTDFKVRVLNSEEGTAAKVRVLIESTDGHSTWTTIGVSTDVVQASWLALVDAIEYKLCKAKG